MRFLRHFLPSFTSLDSLRAAAASPAAASFQDHRPILLLGSGRCGSTLVQRILNTAPEITLWGEHAGFLKGLAYAYQMLTESEEIHSNYYQNPIDPALIEGAMRDHAIPMHWINRFTLRDVDESFRRMIVGLFCGDAPKPGIRFGFKEIRYLEEDGAIRMWQSLFPRTDFIFAVRDPMAVVQSCVMAWHKQEVAGRDEAFVRAKIPEYAERWRASNASILAWIETPGLRHYLLRYEHLTAFPARTAKELFSFLGLSMPHQALAPLASRVDGFSDSESAPWVAGIAHAMLHEWWPIVAAPAETLGYAPPKIVPFTRPYLDTVQKNG